MKVVGLEERAAAPADLPPAELEAPRRGSLLGAWASGTALLAVVEWLLLLKQAATAFSGTQQMLRLLPLMFGNWLPYTLPAVLAWRGSELLTTRLGQRWPRARARLVIAAGVAVLALPYAHWLAKFTFSGPQARTLAFHAAWVSGASALLALGFACLAWASGVRPPSARLSGGWCVLLGCFGAAALWLSRTVMPNEYEPLHAFLAVLGVLGASLFGNELGRHLATDRRVELGRAGALVAVTLFCGVYLARSEEDSWLLWSRTAASRYVTQRWAFLTPNVEADSDGSSYVARPNLETELTAAWRKRRAAKLAPNIVIFSVDGMLPTHVGAYGYKLRPTTPNIDRFAARGVRFNRAFSTYPATLQFNSSLLLGRLVPSSGAMKAPEEFRDKAITRLLSKRGYHVLVKSWFEGSSHNDFDAKYFGIDTNVPKVSAKERRVRLEEPMAERMQRFEKHLLEAKAKQQPVFLWMHLLGTHPIGHEFVPDPKFPFGDGRAERYDSAIAGTDLWLPELEKLMQAHADPARGTIWIICADHGVRVEGPGRDLYAHLVRIPLIIAGPDFQPNVRDELVEASVDLAATVVDLAGIKPPDSYDGISLIPLLMRPDPDPRMAARFIPLLRGTGWKGAVQGPYTLLHYNNSFSFFDSRSDVDEEHNIYGAKRGLARAIWKASSAELQRRLEAFARKPELPISRHDPEAPTEAEEED